LTQIILHHQPRAGFGVVRIDALRFLAGCRTGATNPGSVLSLSLGSFDVYVVLLSRDSF